MNARSFQNLLGHLADAMNSTNWHWPKKRDLLGFLDQSQPIWFLVITCHLGQKLIRADADAGCELPLREDSPLQLGGNRHCICQARISALALAGGGKIDISLIDRNLLDQS